jgi:hypothetical protein
MNRVSLDCSLEQEDSRAVSLDIVHPICNRSGLVRTTL